MELKELALRTREEIEQELNKMYPYPENPTYSDEVDQVLEKRAEFSKNITRLQVEALLDGKLTIDQVVAQQHSEEKGIDDMHRNVLKEAIGRLEEGKNREDIIDKTAVMLQLL